MIKIEEYYQQYLYEKVLYERFGSINVITFEELLDIKKTNCNQSTLKIFKKLLGHSSQDIDTLE